MSWLTSMGARVAIPVGNNRHWDLLAEGADGVLRIQVKTSTCFVKERWDITLCTRGGNRSWSGLVKRLDPDRLDRLFVLVGDGRRWFIPSDRVGGMSGLRLGGPKYAEFEIESGETIPGWAAGDAATTIGDPHRRGDARAAKGIRL